MKHMLFIIMVLATLALSGCGSSSDPASGTGAAVPLQLTRPATV